MNERKQWSVPKLSDEHLPEVLHDLVVLSLRIAANGTSPDSAARAALELRTTQALNLGNSPAATAFLQQLKGDYESGQFSSQPPQDVDQPKQRTKLLLDAAVDALRTAAHADRNLVFPSVAAPKQGESADEALGRQLREVGEAIKDRLRRTLADRKQLVLSLEGLVRQIAELQGGGDQLGRDLEGVNEVIQEVSEAEELSPNVREKLLSRAGTLTARMSEMKQRINTAHAEMAKAQTRIAGLEEQLKQREEEARNDQLTGLPNRRALDTMLDDAAKKAHQNGEPLTVVMLDIDHFKRCNDNYGHRGGDAVLTEVAARLRAEMRGSDFAARYGGEEFILVLPGCSLILGQRVAERVRQAIARRPIVFEGKTISVTTSLGLAELQPKETPGAAIERADQALYSAKKTGRNRWVAAC
jgi:diguanylate cyclase (GGDEF)-like protein